MKRKVAAKLRIMKMKTKHVLGEQRKLKRYEDVFLVIQILYENKENEGNEGNKRIDTGIFL